MHNQIPNPSRTGLVRGAFHLRMATGKLNLKKIKKKRKRPSWGCSKSLRVSEVKATINSIYASRLHVRRSWDCGLGFLERGGLWVRGSQPQGQLLRGVHDVPPGPRDEVHVVLQCFFPHWVLCNSLGTALCFVVRRGFFFFCLGRGSWCSGAYFGSGEGTGWYSVGSHYL